jgi:alanine racemase
MIANVSQKSWLELDAEALRHNVAGVRRLVGDARIMAVLKSNAYGAGATHMARLLADNGIEHYAVATVDEGVSLREAGIVGEILCLTCFDDADMDPMIGHALTPTIYAEEAVAILERHATGNRLPVWIKVDTGLGRLGVPTATAPGLIERISNDPSLAISGIYTTLTESRTRDPVQLRRLLDLRTAFASRLDTRWSAASSNGILSLPASYLDVVRPGIMLLGFPPSEPERMDDELVATADIRPVVTWKTRVAMLKTIAAGEQVGYGEGTPLARDTVVAALTVGWSDGYTTQEDADAQVLIRGRRCKVMTVSANTTVVDVSEIRDAARGDEAVLLGRQGQASVAPETLARCAGGVYRMLAAIPSRIARTWT